MTSEFKIKQCITPAGDWFFISNPEGVRWFIERAIAFAVVEGKDLVDHVCAIDNLGHVHEGDPSEEIIYVHGSDMGPTGISWKEVYDKIPPGGLPVREITELMRDQY